MIRLSPRQAQVADGIRRGLAYQQIADEIGCSAKTVGVHAMAVRRKLGVRSTRNQIADGDAASVARLRAETAAMAYPPTRFDSSGEVGDEQTVCTGCEHAISEPHTWKECAEVLLKWKTSLEEEFVDEERRSHALEIRRREMRGLLHRLTKYVREDRAVTPGTTRLARLTDQVADYLARTNDPRDILRGDTVETEAIGR